MNFIKKFNFQPGSLKKYFANTSWVVGEKIIRSIVLLFVGVYVARYLGPEQFGMLSYAMSFVALFSIGATLGLESIVIRELVKDQTQKNQVLGSTFILKLIGSFLVLGIILIVLNFFPQEALITTIIIIITCSLIFKSFDVIEYYFQAMVQSKYTAIVYFTQLIISSIVKVGFVFIKAPLLWFAGVILFDSFAIAVFLSLSFKMTIGNPVDWRVKKDVIFLMMKDAWPLMLAGLTVTVYMKIDQVMIKNMLDVTQVGFYAAAVRISEAWYFIPTVICSSVFPAIIKAKQNDVKIYMRRLQELYTLMVWMSIPIAILVTLLGGKIITLLYGVEYAAAAEVLKIHIWASIFVFLGVASSSYLIAENYTKISFFRTFIGMIMNLVLNFFMIPKYGIIGAAWATVIAYIVATFSLVIFEKKTRFQAVCMFRAFFVFNKIN